MKKSESRLFKVATVLSKKYADIDANNIKKDITEYIRQQVANASTVSQSSGVMPFVAMLKQDGAGMALRVARDGDTVTVSAPMVNPEAVAGKYAALPAQVKAYLQKNIDLFPAMSNGDDVEYNNFVTTLYY